MSTKEQILHMRDQALAFEELVNKHLDERRPYEPKLETFFPNDGDYGEYDYHDDIITIEWRVDDRCGDHEYYMLEFPISDLWDDSWKTELKKEAA